MDKAEKLAVRRINRIMWLFGVLGSFAAVLFFTRAMQFMGDNSFENFAWAAWDGAWMGYAWHKLQLYHTAKTLIKSGKLREALDNQDDS